MLIRSLKLQDHFARIPAERLKALTCCSRQYDPMLKAQQWRAFLTSTHHAKWFLVLYPHPINTNLHIHILSILTPLSIQHILRVEVVCPLLCARDITVKYQLPSLTTLCVVVHVLLCSTALRLPSDRDRECLVTYHRQAAEVSAPLYDGRFLDSRTGTNLPHCQVGSQHKACASPSGCYTLFRP